MKYLSFNITKALLKSSPGNTKKRRVIAGLAATDKLDWQGQKILLEGINYEYLRRGSGRLNWNHDNDFIIGEPSYVEMQKEGLYVECTLYEKTPSLNISTTKMRDSLEKAEWAWDYANTVAQNGGTPLSYSVEGPPPKVVGNKIVKCMVTKVALTDEPVNTSCSTSALVKSMKYAIQKSERHTDITNIELVEDAYDLVQFLKFKGISPDEAVKLVETVQNKILT